MKKRIMKSVYCEEQYVHDVEEQLALLMQRLQVEHPEWEFDMDLDWE